MTYKSKIASHFSELNNEITIMKWPSTDEGEAGRPLKSQKTGKQ